jgi:molybdenum cofactor synthesis domain-containing protein
MSPAQNTAALVVVGNEILTGKIADENIGALARVLAASGVRLVRVWVIPDDIDDIARTVTEARSRATVVLTSGGVGPTHDDVTMDGVARAFGVEVREHPDMVASIERAKGPMAPDDPWRRLCRATANATIHRADDPWLATAVVDNVFVLPGVPALFLKRLKALLPVLLERTGSVPVAHATVSLATHESPIAGLLDATVAAFPAAEIGSYPKWDKSPDHPAAANGGAWVLLTFDAEGPGGAALANAAAADFVARLPDPSIVFDQTRAQ